MATNPEETQQQAEGDARQQAVEAARQRLRQQAIDSARQRSEGDQGTSQAPQASSGRNFGNNLVAGAEFTGMMATGAAAQVAAGVFGGSETLISAVRGDEDPIGVGADRIRAIEDALTYSPQTESGQRLLSELETLTKPVAEGLQAVFDKANEVGGPGFATQIRTLVEGGPALVGIRPGNIANILRRNAQVRRAKKRADEFGLDLKGDGADQHIQIVRAAEERAGQVRGESMPEVQQAVLRARQVAKDNVDDLFKQARAFRAGVPSKEVVDLDAMARQSLADFDLETMPIVKRRMAELQRFTQEMPADSTVKLQAIEKFRRRLTRNRPSKTDTSQAAALDILKGQVDNWIDNKFTADMVSGDPRAIQAWKNARGAHRAYMEQFKEDKAIRKLAEQEATPEEMRNFIFGSSRTGFDAGAGRVVRRLKDIVGEDSQAMMALRQDAMLNVIDPLFLEPPNLKMFARNYDRMIRGNKSVVDELFVPEQASALDDMVKFARGVDKVSPSVPADLSSMSARALFGHGIAKAALRVSLARRAIDAIAQGGSRANRRAIMSEFLGYDPKKPMLSGVPPAVAGMGQTLLNDAREEPETEEAEQ